VTKAARHGSLTVLMTTDAVGGVWSYALALCTALPAIRFVLATMGPRAGAEQQSALARLPNVELAESDFRLEWMAGAEQDMADSRAWLRGLALRHRADLVHVNGYAHAALGAPCPTLAVAHSDVLSWWRAVHGVAAPEGWDAYRREVANGLSAASAVVALTRSVAADLETHYGFARERSTVIPNGIELGRFARRAKRPVVMAAGRVWDEAKNLALLDRVAPDLAWPIEIAGATAHPERGEIAFSGARMLGPLDPAAMARRLNEAAIFAAPARYEPFGLAILEAAAAGCALVLGDIPSLRENWDGAALLLPPGDDAAWREGLARLVLDKSERETVGAAARSRAAQFGIERTAERYAALYRALADCAGCRDVA